MRSRAQAGSDVTKAEGWWRGGGAIWASGDHGCLGLGWNRASSGC